MAHGIGGDQYGRTLHLADVDVAPAGGFAVGQFERLQFAQVTLHGRERGVGQKFELAPIVFAEHDIGLLRRAVDGLECGEVTGECRNAEKNLARVQGLGARGAVS